MLVAHGWNVDYSAERGSLLLVLLFGVWNAVVDEGLSGTLLGPEGTRVRSVHVKPGSSKACRLVCWVVGDGWLFENCIVNASICGQVFKGARWMPWHQEPMKDVGGHDSPRGVVNQALIRGFPNGETRQSSWAVTRC